MTPHASVRDTCGFLIPRYPVGDISRGIAETEHVLLALPAVLDAFRAISRVLQTQRCRRTTEFLDLTVKSRQRVCLKQADGTGSDDENGCPSSTCGGHDNLVGRRPALPSTFLGYQFVWTHLGIPIVGKTQVWRSRSDVGKVKVGKSGWAVQAPRARQDTNPRFPTQLCSCLLQCDSLGPT